jgi:RNAse (barnase) inhibitor barstar
MTPVLIVDGTGFADLAGFAREFSKLLDGYEWQGDLDAFDDILSGGFGTPESGFVLRWLHSELSRTRLGPALFDKLVGIIRTHGPGGAESQDNVVLDLV